MRKGRKGRELFEACTYHAIEDPRSSKIMVGPCGPLFNYELRITNYELFGKAYLVVGRDVPGRI